MYLHIKFSPYRNILKLQGTGENTGWSGGWWVWVSVSRYHHSISRYTLMSSQPIGRHVCCSLKQPVTPSKVLLLFEDFSNVISSRWCLFIQMHNTTMLAHLCFSRRRLLSKITVKAQIFPIERKTALYARSNQQLLKKD